MGSQYLNRRFAAMSAAELKERFADFTDDERREHGEDVYSGTFATKSRYELTITSMTFPDEGAADNWLMDNTDKWGSAKAVKVGEFQPSFDDSVKGRKLLDAMIERVTEAEQFDGAVIQRVKSGKVTHKTCPACKSSINVKKMKTSYGFEGLKMPRLYTTKAQLMQPTLRVVKTVIGGSDNGKFAAQKMPCSNNFGRMIENETRKVSVAAEVDTHPGTCCPVCETQFLLTDTDLKRKQSVVDRAAKAVCNYFEARYIHDSKKQETGFWLVGAWCPS